MARHVLRNTLVLWLSGQHLKCTCLAMFCTSATFTATAFSSPSPPCHFLCTSHIPSLAFLPHLPHPPQIPICCPDCVVPISAHLPALTRGLSAFHLSACPVGGTVGNASFCSFQRGQNRSNLTTFTFCCMSTRAQYTNSSRARTDNRINSVPQLYSIDLGTFRVALLICYPQRCWNFVIVIL
jgi:hypothetical protein